MPRNEQCFLLGGGLSRQRTAMSALRGILLQKSPRRSCRIKIRNNRIGANGFLNQRCALTPDLESILRTQTGKILLQQNLPKAAVSTRSKIPYSITSSARASSVGGTSRSSALAVFELIA